MAGSNRFILVSLLIAWALVSPSTAFSGCFDTDNILPVPARAFGDIPAGAEFYVEKFTSEQGEDGVYYGTNGGYNFLFIVSPNENEGVAVSDALPSGSWTLYAVQNITSKPVTRFIYGHYHSDHVGDARAFLGATYIAQEKTTAFLASRFRDAVAKGTAAAALPVPSLSWCDAYSFKHGNYEVELAFQEETAGHVPGNTYIWLPVPKVLMLVDVVFPRWVPFNRLGESENLTAVRANINTILSYPFEKFLGGHVARWGDRADILEHQQFFDALLQFAAEAVLPADQFLPLYANGNLFLFLRTWYDSMACLCASKLVDKWGGQLAAVDVYSESHCYMVQEAMRIDADPSALVYPTQFAANPCPSLGAFLQITPVILLLLVPVNLLFT